MIEIFILSLCDPAGLRQTCGGLYAAGNSRNDQVTLKPSATHQEVMAAMKGQIIEEAELMGTYAKTSQKAA